MDYVEHSQEYQQLVEQGPDELGLGEDEDGHRMHYQACQAEDSLENKEKIQSRWIYSQISRRSNANDVLRIFVISPQDYVGPLS